MSETRHRPEDNKQSQEENAAASSDFLYEASHTLKNWSDDDLEMLRDRFDSAEMSAEDSLKTFTLLFETQIGRSLREQELETLVKKLSKAERYITEMKKKHEKIPLEIRQEFSDELDARIDEGNKTAAFIDGQLIDGAQQATGLMYRYMLLTRPHEEWPKLPEN